jgi:hypothetical protein
MAREQYTRNLSDFLILFIQVSTTHTNVFPLKVFASLLKVVSPEGYFFLQPGNLTKSRAITNFSNKKKNRRVICCHQRLHAGRLYVLYILCSCAEREFAIHRTRPAYNNNNCTYGISFREIRERVEETRVIYITKTAEHI